MKKAIFTAAAILLILSLTAPALAATNYPNAINVPNSAATIDGVIEPGEWDEATRIEIKYTDILADQDDGVPGAGQVGGPRPDVISDDEIWLSVRMKIKDGYLYLLEERKQNTPIQFTNDYHNHPYASSGSIIFFCEKGASLNSQDLFVLAETKSGTGPMFGWRELNDHAGMTEIFAEEAKATITTNTFVLEAKIKLTEFGLTEQELKDGKYLVTYCAVKITEPNFSGEPSDLWGDNFQLQYKGVGPWDESVPLTVVAGAEWPPPPPPAPEPEPESAPEAQGGGSDAPEQPAVPVRPAAPPTGDAGVAALTAILAAAAAGVLVSKKRFSIK